MRDETSQWSLTVGCGVLELEEDWAETKIPIFPAGVTLWRLSVLQHWVVMESVFYTTGKPLPLAAICSPFIPLEELDLEQLTELNKYVGNTLQ